jgi:hypothetical protein
MKRSKHLSKMLKEKDRRVALALAALNKNRSDMLALAALFVALLTAAVEFLRR